MLRACVMQARLTHAHCHTRVARRLQNMRFAKRLAKRSLKLAEITADDASAVVGVRLTHASDALAVDRREGRGVVLARSAASEADPWLVRVSYVSPDSVSTSALPCPSPGMCVCVCVCVVVVVEGACMACLAAPSPPLTHATPLQRARFVFATCTWRAS